MNSKTQKLFSAPDPILGFICKDHVTKKRKALGTRMPQTPGPAPLTRPGKKRVAWSRDLTIAFFVTQKSNVRMHAMETVIFVYQKKCRTKVAIDHFRDFFSLRKLSFLTSSCLILKLLLANHRRSRFPELLKPGLRRRSSQGTSQVSSATYLVGLFSTAFSNGKRPERTQTFWRKLLIKKIVSRRLGKTILRDSVRVWF